MEDSTANKSYKLECSYSVFDNDLSNLDIKLFPKK